MQYTFQFGAVLAQLDKFALGAWITLYISLVSIFFGFALGSLLGVGRLFGAKPLKPAIGFYVEIIRNTPLLVQLYAVFFCLPFLGLRLDSVVCAIIAMSAHLAAYVADIVESGVKSVPKGLRESGLALGMSGAQVVRYIVIIPAFRNVYTALGNQFVLLLMGSSLASAIAVDELTGVGNTIMSASFRNFEVFIVCGVIYYILVATLHAAIAIGRRVFFRW